MAQKTHNKLMQKFLKLNGITCRVKLHEKGSLKGQWRFYQPNEFWFDNKELQEKFIALGFKSPYAKLRNHPHGINNMTGNGGYFQVWLIHDDFTLADLQKQNFNK